jgi:hypothetical protein
VFGRLTALRFDGGVRHRWLCDCVCGKTLTVDQKSLESGNTKSCGCIHKEQLVARNTTHGLANTYTYKKWCGMHTRVRDTTSARNACYVGIRVCVAWASFEQFYKDMGEAPSGYSLDRIDNKKGYSKSNCRWVPLALQAANTTRNVVVEYNGVTTHISAHARLVGLSADVVFDRINKLGWSADRALGTPLQQRGKK